MRRYLVTIVLLLVSAGAWAQDSAPGDRADAPDAPDTAEEVSAEQDEDLDLEDESYRDAEEEDFVPTEDIPADQAIPFPTDI